MSDWLHNLPLFWMTLVIFGFTYLVAAAIYLIVRWLAVGDRAHSFKAVTPGVLVAAHDRPFTGHISVAATPLLQVMPEAAATVPASAGTPE